MCGIIGIAYGPGGPQAEPWTPTELLQIMFPAIVHRGHHAWGYMYRDTTVDGVDYFKKGGSAIHKDAMADIVVPDENIAWLVGHVRFATNGPPANNINNHPILHGDVLGVHNGKLSDWQKILDETGREDDTGKVDSEAIFAAVNKWGVTEGLKRIKGDMVSVFVNTGEPDTLYLARTHGRPLVYATTKAGSLIFASELGVITDTGVELLDMPHDWVEGNKVMKVLHGKVLSNTRFRKLSPKTTTSSNGWSRTYAGTGSVHGGASMMFKQDKHGGTYLGGNLWRVSSVENNVTVTRQLTAEGYVDWCLAKYGVPQQDEPEAKLVDVPASTPTVLGPRLQVATGGQAPALPAAPQTAVVAVPASTAVAVRS